MNFTMLADVVGQFGLMAVIVCTLAVSLIRHNRSGSDA